MNATQTTPANFDRTVRPHFRALEKRAMRLTGNDADAADLVQDALVRAFRFWHTFTPGTGVAQWLFTVLRNTHFNRCEGANGRRRVADAHRANLEAVGGENALSPAAAAEALETAQMVRAAVESLPETFRAAVTAIDLEGMSAAEAAAALGCPVNTVRTRALRGRAKLRAALEATA